MIGGVDVRIPTQAGDSALVAAARAVLRAWPHAVFEDGVTGRRYPSFWPTPLDRLEEVFIYRDESAADLWDDEGAVPSALNSMIHVISEEGFTTVVVDDPHDATMEAMIESISRGLNLDLFNFAAEAAA